MGKQSKAKKKAHLTENEEKQRETCNQQPNARRMPLPAICRKERLDPEYLHGEEMFTVEGLLSIGECREFICFAEALGFDHQGSLGASGGEAFRDNDRTSIVCPMLASLLWEQTGLCRLFSKVTVDGKRPSGLNPNVRFYRYVPGQKFGRHIDESVQISPEEATCYTLLVYLSGAFPATSSAKPVKRTKGETMLVGGETVFYGKLGRSRR